MLQKEPLHYTTRSTQNLRLLGRWTCTSSRRWTTRIISLLTSRKHIKKIISYILWVIILWFSSTSTSTKVKMTRISSMKTDTGLSLNKVTKAAPGDFPNLRGILNCSRCNNYFAVYNIQKCFKLVRISHRDSYLKIFLVPQPLLLRLSILFSLFDLLRRQRNPVW